MGGKNCKPVIDPQDAARRLGQTPDVLKRFQQQFVKLSKSADFKGKIDKGAFTTEVLGPIFQQTVGPAIMERMFAVLDSNGSGTIEYDEFLTAICVFYAGQEEDHYRFVFNLYDLDADGYINKKSLRKIAGAMVQGPSTDAAAAKIASPLIDTFVTCAMIWYDRNGDKNLHWAEWRRYADEDETSKDLVKAIQRARKRLLKPTPSTSTSTAAATSLPAAASSSSSSSTTGPSFSISISRGPAAAKPEVKSA